MLLMMSKSRGRAPSAQRLADWRGAGRGAMPPLAATQKNGAILASRCSETVKQAAEGGGQSGFGPLAHAYRMGQEGGMT